MWCSKSQIFVGFTAAFCLMGFIYIYTGRDWSNWLLREQVLCSAVDSKTPELYNRCKVEELLMSPGLKYAQPSTLIGRTDVNSVTNWNAPLVWEGTFDPVVMDNIYKRENPRIAVLVLAVGKYTQFLKGFLETGEKYFFVGFRVTYYIFTDKKENVPKIPLTPGRNISIHDVPSANRWQDVVLSKMKWAKLALETWLHREADYLFMMDVDSVFRGRVGAEALSRLVGTLHRGYYRTTKREDFPYERRPKSQAYIPPTEGDYYYTAAVWGGLLDDMYRLVKHCDEKSQEDAKIGVEAAWQEESHLNKYFLYNKPTKVLSPEYLWSDYEGSIPADIRVVRIAQVVKNYQELQLFEEMIRQKTRTIQETLHRFSSSQTDEVLLVLLDKAPDVPLDTVTVNIVPLND